MTDCYDRLAFALQSKRLCEVRQNQLNLAISILSSLLASYEGQWPEDSGIAGRTGICDAGLVAVFNNLVAAVGSNCLRN